MSRQDQPVLETGISLDEIEQLWFLLQKPGCALNSGSEVSNISNSDHRTTTDDSSPVEVERKRKQVILNRESARRSRWRKKKHFENLTDEMQRLCMVSQELGEQLGLAVHRCHAIQRENQRLRSECVSLSASLSNLHRILIADCDLGANPKSSLVAGLNAFKEKYHVLHEELNESSRLLQASKDEYRSLEREFQKLKEERDYLCQAASESDRKISSAAVEKENVLKELNSEVRQRKKLEQEIKSFSKAFAARQTSVVSLHSNLRSNMEKLMAKTSSVAMPKPRGD